MKLLVFISAFLLIFSCKTNCTIDQSSKETKVEFTENTNGYTPNKENYSVTVTKNSSLTIKEDTTGKDYPVIEKGENIVVEFKYLEKGPEGTADGDYSETLHFEVPNSANKISLKDADLQNVDLLYGKHCFCKGEAGYYKVINGQLLIIKTEKELSFDVSFTINETSQKVKRVTKTIQL